MKLEIDFLNDYIVKSVDDALKNFEGIMKRIKEEMRENPEDSKEYEAMINNLKNINNHLQMDRFGVIEDRKNFNPEYEPEDLGNIIKKGSI